MDPTAAIEPSVLLPPPAAASPSSPSTLVTDVTQLRWQLMRTVEAFQQSERENVELRRDLVNKLKERPVVTFDYKEKSDVLERKLKEISGYVVNCLGPLKSQVSAMRNTVQTDTNAYNNEFFGNMKIMIKKLALENSSLLTANKILLAENFELKSKTNTDSAEFQELASELKMKNSELAKLRKELAKLKDIQAEYDAFKAAATQENRNLKDHCEELALCLTDIKPKYEYAQAEINRLAQKVLGYEQDSKSSYEAHINQQQNIISYYEKLVGELRNENSDLNMVILSQQEQIEKLTNSLLGNKSHFAKFVELKSENINLQTKLSQITKKVNNGAILGTGSVLNNSLYSNNSMSSLSLLQNQVPKGGNQSQSSSFGLPMQAPDLDSGRQKLSNNIRPPRHSVDSFSVCGHEMLSDSLDDSLEVEVEPNQGQNTIKNRILRRRNQKNNQNMEDLSVNLHNENGSYANSYNSHSQDFNFSQQGGGMFEGGSSMINLNLIDDSNSVCEQLAKVESFARAHPKKLIPRHDASKIGRLFTKENLDNSLENALFIFSTILYIYIFIAKLIYTTPL